MARKKMDSQSKVSFLLFGILSSINRWLQERELWLRTFSYFAIKERVFTLMIQFHALKIKKKMFHLETSTRQRAIVI